MEPPWISKATFTPPNINYNLVPNGAHAENYWNPPGVHPSLGDYLWMEAGTDFGVNGLAVTALPVKTLTQNTHGHLSYQLDLAGKSWKAYSGKTWPANTCPLTQWGVPQVFFKDVTDDASPTSPVCIRHVRPLSELAGELAKGTAPDYNFIVPSLCDDMHKACGGTNPIVDGDNWLKANVPAILNSTQYRAGGALFIVWDEAAKGDGPIGMIVMSPFAKQEYENKIHYTHGSLLRTVEEICTKSNAPSGRKSSAGAFHPRVFLGRVLSRHAMSSSWSWENSERSVPLGRYWRSRPLVFSLMPRSQGACGWAK